MQFTKQPSAQAGPIPYINDQYLTDEEDLVRRLAEAADPGEGPRRKISDTAEKLVQAVRRNRTNDGGIEAFMQQYDLSSEEGVLLMCIAEALLRIPDADTADKLIADKITSAQWNKHLGESDSLFVNASTWGLMLTGQLLKFDEAKSRNAGQLLGKLASRAGEPVVRTAMKQAMRIMGHQFVMGRTIKEAMERSTKKGGRGYRYSFDMLGESALTIRDTEPALGDETWNIYAMDGSQKQTGAIKTPVEQSIDIRGLPSGQYLLTWGSAQQFRTVVFRVVR